MDRMDLISHLLNIYRNYEIEEENSEFNRRFSYINEDNCPIIFKAVLLNDIDSVREYVRKGNSVNLRDRWGNTPLHLIDVHENLEVLSILLAQPDVNLEIKNDDGETPLMKCIGETSDEIIIKLLDAGCDVNTRNSYGKNVLHVALNHQRTMVEELLKRGADLNSPCGCDGSALFHAIKIFDLEFVSMFLHYNADTSIKNDSNVTPFLYSLNSAFDRALAYEILPFVEDFSSTDPVGLNCISLAAFNSNPIVMDIIPVVPKKCLNQVDCNGNPVLYYSLRFMNNLLFKEVFSKMDHNILLKTHKPFLESVLSNNKFSISEWLECIYLLASSNIFPKLMNVFLHYLDSCKFGLFTVLLNRLDFDQIPQDDREKIFYIFLSSGAIVFYDDIINYYKLFGPSKEINILLDFTIYGNPPLTYSPFMYYICGKEPRKPYKDLKKDIMEEINRSRNLVDLLRFFTFSFTNTDAFIQRHAIDLLEIGQEELQVPSLLELCRNEVRFTVRSSFKINSIDIFYEAVNKLPIPRKIKDLILFKIPLR